MAADPDGGADAAAAQDASADAASAPTDATAPPADATVTGSSDANAGDDGSAAPTGPEYVTPDGALPPYNAGNVFDLLCVQDPGVTFFDYSQVKSPYTTPAECKTFANTDHATARSCLCDKCFTLQQECDALTGCKAIQACGFRTGCNSASSCYLIQGLCYSTINQYGTGSVSTALSQNLETCGMMNGCPSQ
jgi:hypothetical protein